ncbi:Protein CBG27963 [Caenorhabditis briggsae]|nr:Protein CBG27963 [Caenorhabditis briggsae]UMM43094.1 hypothetical protein L5515_018699 [Caenorhabditis briggsae]CAS00135.1 Protein CBG27963 [Caenorhabditis briggsae]
MPALPRKNMSKETEGYVVSSLKAMKHIIKTHPNVNPISKHFLQQMKLILKINDLRPKKQRRDEIVRIAWDVNLWAVENRLLDGRNKPRRRQRLTN